jgi:peptidoglycan/LPS O-acetylase OafA/YrhL
MASMLGSVPSAGFDAPVERRYAVIDVVRGVSIVLVILLHVQIRIPLQETWLFDWAPPELWRLFCRNGKEGVRMFFVVSGFLITTTSLRRWGSLPQLDPRRFYQLRFARIAPTLGALLVVLSVLHLAGVNNYVIDAKKASLSRALVAASTFHLNWLEASGNFYLPPSWDVLWSLSVEEAFYLLFPLIALAFRWPLGGRALLLGLFALGAWVRVTLVAEPMWQSKGYLSCADALALGCFTAVVSHGRQLSRPLVHALLWGGSALGIAALAFAKNPQLEYFEKRDLDLVVLQVATACVMVAGARVTLGSVGSAVLRPLTACGRASYEIYLTHAFVVMSAVSWFRARGAPPSAVVPLVAAVLVLSWCLGAAVERWLSAPANRWLRRKLGAGASASREGMFTARSAPSPPS